MTLDYVVIADDHSLYRRGLALLLQDHFECASLAEVSSFDEAADSLARLAAEHPDGRGLALFDLQMPGMAGPETLSTICETYPSCRVAVISGSDDPSNLSRCMSIGLSGFIPKHMPTQEIVEAFGMIMEGRTFVPRSSTRRAEWKRPEPQVHRSSRPFSEQQANITPRQRRVLAHIAEGLDDTEIAQRLGLSPQTVAIHVAALHAHLGADTRAELAEAARRLTSELH